MTGRVVFCDQFSKGKEIQWNVDLTDSVVRYRSKNTLLHVTFSYFLYVTE